MEHVYAWLITSIYLIADLWFLFFRIWYLCTRMIFGRYNLQIILYNTALLAQYNTALLAQLQSLSGHSLWYFYD